MNSIDRLDTELGLIPDPQERLSWLVGLGRRLPVLAEAERADELFVRGCVSRVWLARELDGQGRLRLRAAADSPLVLGLVTALLRVAEGRLPAELPAGLPEPLARHGVLAQLTPTRRHGLEQVWQAIRKPAER